MTRWLLPLALVAAVAVLAAGCGGDEGAPLDTSATAEPSAETTDAVEDLGDEVAAVETVPGMPAVPDPTNLYSETGAGMLSPATDGALQRVYVPNEVSGTVTVIDPATLEVIDTFESGFIPQHVVPAYDMSTLYVLNNNGNTIVPIDPLTGEPSPAIPVENPYNLYFTPDGSEAIVVAEGLQQLRFSDPVTFEPNEIVQTDCHGLNHMDFSIDGRYAIATCEFDGRMIKVDMVSHEVVDTMQIDIGMSGKADPVKDIAQPQDVRVSPDGRTFYVADLITDGVYLIDGESFTQVGFIRTGVAAHGLYPSRDASVLYVVNRGTNLIPAPGSFKGQSEGSVTVLDWSSGQVVDNWPVPDGGSPDMGNLTVDGSQLWLGGRYDAEVYVFDTQAGELIARIPAGENPHGLTVWPQPGRYSFGHTGNMR